MEIQFATPGKAPLPATKFTRMVLVDGTVYMLNYWTDAPQDAASAAERNRFFTSFQVKARPLTMQESTHRLGLLAGRLLGYAAMGLLVLGLLVLGLRRQQRARR